MRIFFLSILSLAFFIACNQVESLKKETDAIHDQAMKDMAEANKAAIEIKQFMISATMTPEQSSVYMNTLSKIGNAENDMMGWMVNYKSDLSGMSSSEAEKYLKEQNALIKQIHDKIKTARDAGKDLLAKSK